MSSATFTPYRQTTRCRFYQPDFVVGFDCCSLPAGEGFEVRDLTGAHFLFVRKGEVSIDYNEHRDIRVRAGEMLFLPRATDCRVQAVTSSKLLILGYDNQLKVCLMLMLERLEPMAREMHFEVKPLEICRPLELTLRAVEAYVRDRIDCACLYELKQQEICYLFNHYYTSEQKAMFFHPVIGQNFDFRSLVLSNYTKARSVGELAAACGYKQKNFARLFKDYFGMPAYQWFQQRRASHVQTKLHDTRIPIKEIVAQHGFASQAHLNAFCKKHLGATPVQLRNRFQEELPFQPTHVKR